MASFSRLKARADNVPFLEPPEAIQELATLLAEALHELDDLETNLTSLTNRVSSLESRSGRAV